MERKSNLRAALYVKDPAAVRKAFSVGVGERAEFAVGAGASNLKLFDWKNLPRGFYPFDLPDDYRLDEATVW